MSAKKAAKKAAAKKTAAKVPAKKAAAKAAKVPARNSAGAKKSAQAPPPFESATDVELAAYLNYRNRLAKGEHGDSLGDWLAAEKSRNS